MDLTSLWIFLQKNQKRLGTFLLGILIFIAGWQGGRVTSPYYAAAPIVFEDRQCEECSSSGGTPEELSQLKEAGIAKRKPETKKAETKEGSSASIVAGATTQQGQFVASKNSKLYHDPSCSSVSRIKEENKRWFANQEEASVAGYSPSKCTKDLLGI